MGRLLRVLTLGAIAAAIWVLLKELLEEDSFEQAPAPAAENEGEPSKAELYERAKQLDIEGRSKMSKERLAEAIAAVENGSSE